MRKMRETQKKTHYIVEFLNKKFSDNHGPGSLPSSRRGNMAHGIRHAARRFAFACFIAHKQGRASAEEWTLVLSARQVLWRPR